MDKYNATESYEQRHIWTLEGKLNRAEKSARKHQSDAAHWQRLCHKAEAKLAEIGQQARDRGLMEGLGYGLILGAAAVYAEALIWKKLLK